MESVFKLCKILIENGRTVGLVEKMDVYLANDRLTPAEYEELLSMIPKD